MGNLGRARFGGVIRDSNGNWVRGFVGSLGISTNTHVELLAMKTGLDMVVGDKNERSHL